MRRFFRLLNYLIPYKWYVSQNIIYNILGAFFALFSFAMVIPFLGVLFESQSTALEPMDFEFSTDYFMHTLNYHMGRIMENRGEGGALVLVSMLVVGFSLLKTDFCLQPIMYWRPSVRSSSGTSAMRFTAKY